MRKLAAVCLISFTLFGCLAHSHAEMMHAGAGQGEITLHGCDREGAGEYSQRYAQQEAYKLAQDACHSDAKLQFQSLNIGVWGGNCNTTAHYDCTGGAAPAAASAH